MKKRMGWKAAIFFVGGLFAAWPCLQALAANPGLGRIQSEGKAMTECIKMLHLDLNGEYDGNAKIFYTEETARQIQDCMMGKGFLYGSLLTVGQDPAKVPLVADKKTVTEPFVATAIEKNIKDEGGEPDAPDKAAAQAIKAEAARTPNERVPVFVPYSGPSDSKPVFLH